MAIPIINVYPTGTVNFDATITQDFKFVANSIEWSVTSYQIFIYRKSNNSIAYDTGKVTSVYQDDNYVYHHTVPANTLQTNVDYYWKVQAWNEGNPPIVGNLSNAVFFSCIAKPIVTVLTTGNYYKPTLTVNWSANSETSNQVSFRVVIRDSGIIINNIDFIKGIDTSYSFSKLTLASGKNYNIEVDVLNDDGLIGVGYGTITTNFSDNLPPKPTLILTPDNITGRVTCSIINPVQGGNEEPTLYNKIYSKDDANNWIVIANNIIVNGIFIDINVNMEKTIEYYVSAVAPNEKENSSVTASTKLSLPGIIYAQLYPIEDINSSLNIKYDVEFLESFGINKIFNYFNGRKRPVADIGENENRSFNLRFNVLDYIDINIIKGLENAGSILFYRDKKGRAMFCSIIPNTLKIKDDGADIYNVSFELIQVDYLEEG